MVRQMAMQSLRRRNGDITMAHDLLAEAERRGTWLVLIGKAIIIAVMTVYLMVNFSPPGIYWPLLFVAGFILTGLIQLGLNLYRPGWLWARTALIVIDAVALAVVISIPNPLSGFDLPPQYPYRFSYFALLIVYIASVGYSYKPSIALTAGLASAAAWAVLATLVGMNPDSVGFDELGTAVVTRDTLLQVVAHPNYFSESNRFLEVMLLVLVGVLIAGLVWRSKRQVRRLLAAEQLRERAVEQRRFVRETFGKYVPETVATQILRDRGQLVPQKRHATILFADLEGFTDLSDRVSPEALIRILNEYFEAAGKIITAHGGTINQFQGDALLASFNVPITDEDHMSKAVRAGSALVAMVDESAFEGQQLRVRVGINTGEVFAGAVGSGDRLSYTVLGNCVNVAARLEQLNKQAGTQILMSAETAGALGDGVEVSSVGEFDVRGISRPMELYTTA